MSIVWTKQGVYRSHEYHDEADLEAAILDVQCDLFGDKRIYLNVKKKIGVKGGLQNIPDGYLIDLASSKPRLYVVENELERHDPLRHVAVQILQFALSFESQPRAVRSILFNALQQQPSALQMCETYAATHSFRNLDHFLDALVFDGQFTALVVIDQIPDNLERILSDKFRFGVEVIELARYQNETGERYYHFEPFLADIASDLSGAPGPAPIDPLQLDTVVVPAREDGFQETFVGEQQWYAVRLHGSMRPQIKHIAVYRKAPVSAITHIAPVASIEPWGDTGKYVIKFAEPAREIEPLRLVSNGKVKAPQNIRYAVYKRLLNAKTLDDVWQ